jgi:hypothetical protein
VSHARIWSTPSTSAIAAGILPVVRSDPQRLLRGFGKLVVVVLAAGLAGTGLGIALAQLPGNEDSTAPALPAVASATTERASIAPSTPTVATLTTIVRPARPTTGTRTHTAPAPSTSFLGPRVQVLFARLHRATAAAGHVTVRIRVINRGPRPPAVRAPTLLTGSDEIARDCAAGAVARPLLRSLAAGSSATSVLRFTTSAAVTERLTAAPRARLRIASRSIALKLASSSSG